MDERERKRAVYRKKLEEFCLMDDTFSERFFMDDIENTELLVKVILNRKDLKVTRVQTQYSIMNLLGRSIRLDIKARDSEGRLLNVEIQNEDEGANPERARYYSGMLDANALVKGDDFTDLPETYVIFITRNDVLEGNIPIYHIDRTIKENGRYFQDRAHIVYVNGADRNMETELGRLVHDLHCKKASEMFNKSLADKMRYYKESEEGIEVMCKVMDDLIQEERRETEKETAIKVTIENGIDYGIGKERILQQLIKKCFLTREQAEEMYDRYSQLQPA